MSVIIEPGLKMDGCKKCHAELRQVFEALNHSRQRKVAARLNGLCSNVRNKLGTEGLEATLASGSEFTAYREEEDWIVLSWVCGHHD